MNPNLVTYPIHTLEFYKKYPSQVKKEHEEWKRGFEKAIRERFAGFSNVMASCKNDDFLEEFYRKTLDWLTETEKEVLGE